MGIRGKKTKWVVNLQTFGECKIVKEGKSKKSVDRSIAIMFVGYPVNREEDSVQMWNQITNGVVTTRDVIWMKRMFFEKADSSEWMSDEKIVHKTEAEDSKSIVSAMD